MSLWVLTNEKLFELPSIHGFHSLEKKYWKNWLDRGYAFRKQQTPHRDFIILPGLLME
jgi:hypothetical protein